MRRLPLLALALLAACSSAEEPAPSTPAGAGGSGGAPACVDLQPTGACRFEGRDSGCAPDEVCTLAPGASCGDAPCCTLALACAPAAEGTRPGGYPCSADGDCESGLCLTVQGVGLCYRACEIRGADPAGSCLPGQLCAPFSLDATRSLRACVGVAADGSFDAAATFCLHDADCADGRRCRVKRGTGLYDGRAFGRCEPAEPPSGLTRACEAGQELTWDPLVANGRLPRRGTVWSDACEGDTGLCHNGCYGNDPDACNCAEAEREGLCRKPRCVPTCRTTEDCPSPLTCQPLDVEDFTSVDEDFLFRICLLPPATVQPWGCYDETDCCKGGLQRSGKLCCNVRDDVCAVPPPETTHCRVTVAGARFESRCVEPSGLAPLGAACAGHDACESGLCAPDGRCTSPCDPGPGDRCAELVEGSVCCGQTVGDACVPACRTDCATGPTCIP